MVIYILVVIIAMLSAHIAQKKNNLWGVCICIAVLALFSGLRGENVGIDTAEYYKDFNILLYGGYVYSKDYAYLFISNFLLNIFKTPAAIVFIYSSITNALIISRLWTLRKKASFKFMVFIYIAVFYLESMNIMRQFLAVSIVFFATKYLEKKKYCFYLLLMILASAFHRTALLGIGIIIIYLLVESRDSKKIRLLLCLSFIPTVLISIWIYQTTINKYIHYFSQSESDLGFMIVYQICCVCLIILISKFCIRRRPFSRNFQGETKELDRVASILFFISLFLCSFGMFFRYMDRLGLYFQMFEMPFWGQAIKITRYRHLITTLALVFVLYYFIMQFVNNGQGVFPYVTFWM